MRAGTGTAVSHHSANGTKQRYEGSRHLRNPSHPQAIVSRSRDTRVCARNSRYVCSHVGQAQVERGTIRCESMAGSRQRDEAVSPTGLGERRKVENGFGPSGFVARAQGEWLAQPVNGGGARRCSVYDCRLSKVAGTEKSENIGDAIRLGKVTGTVTGR